MRIVTPIAFVTLLAAANGHALLIDFTDDRWSGADGQTNYSQDYDGLTVSVEAATGTLSFNDPGPNGSGDLARDGDGLGINDDEISYDGTDQELISVAFSEDVLVTAYFFFDLFDDEGPGGEAEAAQVVFHYDAATNTFVDLGTATDRIGYYVHDGISESGFDHITFMALNGSYSDFALAAIDIERIGVAVTPIPSTLVLFLSGLGAFGLYRRRIRAS